MAELEHELELMRSLEETNPMLGTRGVRVGILHPEIYQMQVRAIVRAARAVRERLAHAPKVEIMIPLVAYERELELARARVLAVAAQEGFAYGVDFNVGTMIELPRACFIADRIARHADFFSFGTNDLTQTTIGFSRDDVEGRIIPGYVAERILDVSPFATIDEAGVGELCEPPSASAAKAAPTSSWASVASTAATPPRSTSSIAPASTTSAVPRSACRSPASPPPRRRSPPRGRQSACRSPASPPPRRRSPPRGRQIPLRAEGHPTAAARRRKRSSRRRCPSLQP